MDAPHPLAELGAPAAPRGGRHVLLLDFDLFDHVGGGQSVYRRLIARCPQDTFYYFRRSTSPEIGRPDNAVAIPFTEAWSSRTGMGEGSAHLLWQYLECRNLAASVAAHLPGRDFDVVDVPDYSQRGVFIRPALAAEGIRAGTVAVALHGTLSDALGAGWPQGGRNRRMLAELRLREHLQFRVADARYAISDAYAERWRRRVPLPVNSLDPLCVIDGLDPTPATPREGPPDLAFIGRREKWKGPDLFLDLAWCTPRDLYRRLIMAGPEGPNHLGIGSAGTLAAMARQRGLEPEMPGGMSRAEVANLLRGRTLLLLPSRYDTFNLTALEAIGQGCPVLVSDRTGAARWLRENLPSLGWMLIEVGCSRSAAGQAAEVLRDYDAHRAALLEALAAARLAPRTEEVRRIWDPAGQVDVEARQTVQDLASRFELLAQIEHPSRLRRLARQVRDAAPSAAALVGPLVPQALRRRTHLALGSAKALWRLRRHVEFGEIAKQKLKEAIPELTGLSPRTMHQLSALRSLPGFRRAMIEMPERTSRDLAAKIRLLSDAVPGRLADRTRLFRELARLERRAGRDLIAATYALRLMRWMGEDRHGDLPFVTETLAAHGFAEEARTALAMFGAMPEEERDARSLDLMRDAFARNLSKPELPLAVLEDGRGDIAPRASVIVSLYNAADKLPVLLDNLAQQTLAHAGGVEVVLVDSNSPSDERAALEAWRRSRGATLPIAYARSAARETIQAAWNRGIRLARAPYLAFLGADEGLHPDALRQLAAALDADRGVDWAMADSLVTNVDRQGVFDSDLMAYDRRGYRQDLVYLETCYLSWVGGLYRRTIHDRFGYYDEGFRAAGDTEFKNRVMPHIRSVHVPGMLGVFNNYPEERTTQHPRAEIEDLRAWYLWRTRAGMGYAFGRRPAEEAVALLRDCFSYRKSYCGHLSTDFDLAHALALHLAGRRDAPELAQVAVAVTGEALAALRAVERLPGRAPRGTLMAAQVGRRVLEFRRRLAQRHAALIGLPAIPHEEVFNDNRYEQHWWSWSG